MKILTAISPVIFILLSVALDFAIAYRLNTENRGGVLHNGDVGGCEEAMKRAATLDRATVILDSPSAIYGKWVSESCETRPGPEFLLRSYTFYPNNTFRLLQFYYGDESCSNAGYTVIVRGQLRDRGLYSLNTVSIVPHASDVAYHLSMKVNSSCPGRVRKRWKPFKEYFLLHLSDEPHLRNHKPFTTISDVRRSHTSVHKKHIKHHDGDSFNCLHALSLVFHELHRFKVQIRPGVNDKFKTMYYRQELLLGDIHSRLESRASYEPTAYQVPLLRVDASAADTLALNSASLIRSESLLNMDPKGIEEARGRIYEKSYIGHFDIGSVGELQSILASKTEENKPEETNRKDNELFNHCHVCSAVYGSSEKSPPYLMAKPKLPLSLSGEWVSVHCEQRPMSIFLTRHFRFYTADRTWIVEYRFFYDNICSGHSFSVTAAGHYKLGKPNHNTPGGTEVDFHVEKASLTVFEPGMLQNLERDPDCGLGPWRLGYPREMSGTHGCRTLGLIVPSIEYELMRLEADFYGSPLLFMGQAYTDNRKRSAKERPTSYQAPLVKCNNLPSHSDSLRDILNNPLYGDDVYTYYGSRALEMEMGYLGSSSIRWQSSILLLIFNIIIIFIYVR